MLLSGLIGIGISSIGSAIGGVAAKKQAQKAEDLIYKQQNSNRELQEKNRVWYEQQRNTDYLDTSEARSTLSRINSQNQKDIERFGNNSVSMGHTEESKVAAAGALNENYSQSVNSLAGIETARQDNLRKEYKALDNNYETMNSNLNAMKYNTTTDKANALSVFGGIASGVGNMFGSTDMFKGKKVNFRSKK